MTDGKPTLLDAFCYSGGATRGYQWAGFHVTGIDINYHPDYCGDKYVVGDAIEFIKEYGAAFDYIHASPPCHASTTLTLGTNQGREYPQLIPTTRKALNATGRPYVIENVPLAPIRKDLMLCGEMFGLNVIRHRHFEFGNNAVHRQLTHIAHRGGVSGYRHGEWYNGPYFQVYGNGGGKGTTEEWQHAMGIDWTDDRKAIAQAIPPAYSWWIGKQWMKENVR
jgi:hypothetical protein